MGGEEAYLPGPPLGPGEGNDPDGQKTGGEEKRGPEQRSWQPGHVFPDREADLPSKGDEQADERRDCGEAS
jgi:hypothetical protein